MKIYTKPIIVMTLLYFIQFVIAPIILKKYFPQTNEAYLIFTITTFLFCLLGFIKIDDKLLHWFIADIIYFILIILYAGKGAYGIGMRGINLDGLQSEFSKDIVYIGGLIAIGTVVIIQSITKLLAKFCTRFISK